MELRIDRQALVPVVQQIVDALYVWLRHSGTAPGTRLPTARQIARANLLSQSSVVEACERLVAQGVLGVRHGAGFVVVGPASVESTTWSDSTKVRPLVVPSELQLGGGGLPESWRETDDLGYAIRQVSRTNMAALFNYNTPLGLPSLRQHILKRLSRLDIVKREDQIITTAGASQGLDLIVRALLKPGDHVVVEKPGSPWLFELLRLHRIEMLEVSRTPAGPDVAALEELLRAYRPQALFINSFHHNPTGTSLAPAVAARVLQLARAHGTRVIEDDVYADLHSGAGARLAALDADTEVIYVGSFSKTLSSSLRVGFVVASAETIVKLADVKRVSSMGTSAFCEAVLSSLLDSGAYRKVVQRLRQRLNLDRNAALQSLQDAEWEVFGRPVGGLFIWARPRASGADQVQKLAKRFGVVLSDMAAFSATGETSDWLRINVSRACDPRAKAFFLATTLNRPQTF